MLRQKPQNLGPKGKRGRGPLSTVLKADETFSRSVQNELEICTRGARRRNCTLLHLVTAHYLPVV